MASPIDLDTLREALADAERMIAHYGRHEEHERQNAALQALDMAPLHGEHSIRWDRDQAAKHGKQANVLRAVIAHFDTGAQQVAA